MAEGITVRMKTTRGELQELTDRTMQLIREQAIQVLLRAGEEAVNEARLHHTYTDRTGNLTSSIGYGIAEDGRMLQIAGFQQVLDGTEGISTGQSFLQELAAQTKGLSLIVVAGRYYAVYVEGRGYNVLQSSQIVAAKLVKELFAMMAAKDSV